MNVLVVGGAGYIGSHCVRQLAAAGHRPVVLDNFAYGHRGALAPDVTVHDADLGDETAVKRILLAEKIDAVIGTRSEQRSDSGRVKRFGMMSTIKQLLEICKNRRSNSKLFLQAT